MTKKTVEKLKSEYTAIMDYSKKIELLNQLLMVLNENRSYEDATQYYPDIVNLIGSCADDPLIIKLLINIGQSFYYSADFEKSLEIFLNALNRLTDQDEVQVKSDLYMRIGTIHADMMNTKKALECFKKAKSLADDFWDGELSMRYFNNVGILYEYEGSYSSAIENYLKALNASNSLPAKKGQPAIFFNLGRSYCKLSNYKEAIESFNHSIKLLFEIAGLNPNDDELSTIPEKHVYGIVRNLREMGLTYQKSGDLNQALQVQKQALQICRRSNVKMMACNLLENLSVTYSSMGKYKKAYENMREHNEILHAMHSARLEEKIAEIQIRYESEKNAEQAVFFETRNKELAQLNQALKQSQEKQLQLVSKLNHANEELKTIRTKLEQRMNLKTMQLERAIGKLRNEIRDRKQAEEALLKSEETYRSVVENASEAIIVAQDGYIKFCNASTSQLTGYSSEQLYGMSIIDLIHPDDQEMVIQRHRNRLLGEQIESNYTFRVLDAKKSIRLAEINSVRIMWEDKPATLNFLTDVTIRTQIQKEFQKVHKLESLGILAGSIAHDFNNMLSAVTGYIHVALLHVKDSPYVEELLKKSEKAAYQAGRLTRQLLTFAKGGAPITKVHSIADIINEASNLPLLGNKINLKTEIENDLWNVKIDRIQISQVFSNLTINAIQALQDGGSIRIKAQNVTLGADCGLPVTPGRFVRTDILDNGPGIPPELLGKIFDPFFTTKEEGSGLGLAITYSIIKNHNGHIQINSSLSIGTEVSIYLPATDEPLEDNPVDPIISESANGLILFMEDDRMLRELTRIMIVQMGFDVITARNGSEALEIFNRQRRNNVFFDLVILDLVIPGGMGAKETIAALKALDNQVPVILTSGYLDHPVVNNYDQYGFIDTIAKPFDYEEMAGKIHKLLR